MPLAQTQVGESILAAETAYASIVAISMICGRVARINHGAWRGAIVGPFYKYFAPSGAEICGRRPAPASAAPLGAEYL
jgi:hypothetical protein